MYEIEFPRFFWDQADGLDLLSYLPEAHREISILCIFIIVDIFSAIPQQHKPTVKILI